MKKVFMLVCFALLIGCNTKEKEYKATIDSLKIVSAQMDKDLMVYSFQMGYEKGMQFTLRNYDNMTVELADKYRKIDSAEFVCITLRRVGL